MRNATLEELDAAVEEASRRDRCPLESKLVKWMGDASEWSVAAETAEWTRLREARHLNLKVAAFSSRTFLLYNHYDLFQVSWRKMIRSDIYHVQSIITPSSAAYYRCSGTGGQPHRIVQLPPEVSLTRNPLGVIREDLGVLLSTYPASEPVAAHETPMHHFIQSHLYTL